PARVQELLTNTISDYTPCKTTNIETTLNPDYMPLGNKKGDEAFTEQFMRACRKSIGKRCIFDNHDFDTSPPSTIVPVLESMKKLGPPMEFQTYHVAPPDWDGTIKKAASMGAGS